MHRKRPGKAQLISELAHLEYVVLRQETEIEQLKETILRVSIKTDLGIRPVYQATLEATILATIFAGGQGILINDLKDGPIIEVISTYKPPLEQEDDDIMDRAQMALWEKDNPESS
jgi:hypothetical protein